MHLLREEWDHLEADFTRFYNGADLRTLCWGPHGSRWSARRLLTHIQALPSESATRRSQRGAEADWGQTNELLAGVVDVLRIQTYTLARPWGVEMPEPEMVTRPGQPAPEPQIKTMSLTEWANTL